MKLFADVFQQSLGKLRKKEENGPERLFRVNQRTSPKVDERREPLFFVRLAPLSFFLEDRGLFLTIVVLVVLVVVVVVVAVVWDGSCRGCRTNRTQGRAKRKARPADEVRRGKTTARGRKEGGEGGRGEGGGETDGFDGDVLFDSIKSVGSAR